MSFYLVEASFDDRISFDADTPDILRVKKLKDGDDQLIQPFNYTDYCAIVVDIQGSNLTLHISDSRSHDVAMHQIGELNIGPDLELRQLKIAKIQTLVLNGRQPPAGSYGLVELSDGGDSFSVLLFSDQPPRGRLVRN